MSNEKIEAVAAQLADARARGEGMRIDGHDRRIVVGPGVYFALDGRLVDRGLETEDAIKARGEAVAVLHAPELAWDRIRIAQPEADELRRETRAHRGTFGGPPDGAQLANRVKLVHAYFEPRFQPFDDDLEPLPQVRGEASGFTIGPIVPRDDARILRVDWACRQTDLVAGDHFRVTMFAERIGEPLPPRKKTWRLREVDDVKPFVVRELLQHQVDHHGGQGVSVESTTEDEQRVFVCGGAGGAPDQHRGPVLRLTSERCGPQALPLDRDEPFTAFCTFAKPQRRIDFLLLVWED